MRYAQRPKFPKPKAGMRPGVGFRYLYKRTYRDVACRYIQRFGGSTYKEPTAIDDYEVYLRNRDGEIIATISSFDRFPKPVDTQIFDNIPF